MVGRGSQVARGLNMIASRVVKAKDELAEYGIQVEDANGNLKSTYNVLAELKPKWDNMTESERVALGETLAGINQYRVLASVMSNFQTAVDATETAYNSAGSAAQENERYMSSLEAQTNNLKATFQDFANNVITKEMISSVLNLANAFLELLNTPFGQAATRLALLTTGLTALYNVAKYFGAPFFAPLISGIGKLNTGFGVLTSAIGGNAMALTALKGSLVAFASTVLPIVAAVGLLVATIAGFNQMYSATFPTVENVNKAIEENNQQLETNQQRLDEINKMPWNERTQAILDEKEALEAENEELRKSIELEKQRGLTAAKTVMFGSAADVKGGTFLGGFSTTPAEGYQSNDVVAQNIEQAKGYIAVLEKEGRLTDEQNAKAQELLGTMAERAQYYEMLRDNADSLTKEQQEQLSTLEQEYNAYQQLVQAYDQAVYGGEALVNAYIELNNTGVIAEETYQRLIGIYPQLADGAVQTANGYQIQESALLNLMSAEQRQQAEITNLVNGFIAEAQQSGATEQALLNLVQAQITASNTGLNFTQQIAALQALAQQAGYTAAYVQNVLSAGLSQSNIERTARGLVEVAARKGQKLSYQDALAKATKQANQELERRWKNLTSSAPTGGYTPAFSGGSQVSVPSTKPSGSGTSGKTSSSTHDDSKRSEAQAEIKQLQAQQDVIQDKIDAVNEKYDAQLKELEDINDALEEQIRLQKLLEDLAEAKSRTKMVFKDGRFQYVQDTDAVSKAQANLDEYYRDKELAAKKKQIEAARQLELAGLQAEKKRLEERIKYWRNFSSDMSGVYNSSLSDLTDYVNQWNSYVDSMKTPTTDTSGGGSSGGGSTIPSGPTPSQIKNNEAIAAKYPPSSSGYDSSKNSAFSASTTKTLQSWYKTTADGIWGKNSYTAAGNRNISTAYALWMAIKSTYSSFAEFERMGGYAQGTLSSRSGLSMVGEQGPELRVLNKGDGVIPAKQTARLWSFANDPAKFLSNIANYRGGSSEIINVQNVTLPNVRNAQDFVAGLRNLAYQRAYAR